jgi:hypothetical protein
MTKPVKVAFEGDESDLIRSLDKAGAGLDGFAADAQSSGAKAEASLSGVGDKADALASTSSQAAGGIGDLGGALSLMPGPLGLVGSGMEAAAPAIMGVTGAADLLNLATTKFPALAKAQAVATNVVATAQRALNAVMAGNPIALVVLAIVALIAIFAVLYAKNEGFRELVNRVFGALKDRVGEAVEKVQSFAGTVKEKLENAGQRFGDLRDAAANAIGTYSDGGGGALGKLHNVVEAVTSLPGTIRDKAAGVFGPVRDAADNAIGSFTADGGGALGKLHNVVSAVTGIGGTIREKSAGMWDGIKDSFAGAINAIIRKWNDLSFTVDIPDAIPGLPDSYTINTPNIPEMADGGIIRSRTLLYAGESGDEAIIPLDKMSRYGFGGTTVRIDVTVAPTASPEETGRQVQRALDAYYRVGGRSAA